jgi:hypothetical protein
MPRDARCSIEDRHVAGAAGLRARRQRDAHRRPWPFVVVATAVGFRFVVDVFSEVGARRAASLLRRSRAPGQHFVVRRTALFAGRAVHRPARVSSASPPHAHPAAVCAANGWRRPSDEQTQRCVVSTFVRPLGQRVRMNGAEHGPSAGVDHGHNDLGSARRGEHDPVARGPAGGDVHSFASVCGVHRHSLLGPTLASRRRRATANRPAGTPRRSSVRILAIDDRGVVVAVLMLLPLRAGPALRRAAEPATGRRRRCCPGAASLRRRHAPAASRPQT